MPIARRIAIYQEPAGAAGGPAYKFSLTVDATEVGADITDYELLVTEANLPAGFWTHVESDGKSIEVWNSAETTQLDHDLIYIDTTGSEIVMRVGVPSLSSSVDTVIYIYYDDAAASDASTSDTYKSTLELYWPCQEAPTGTITDRTSNSYDGTSVNMDSGNLTDGKFSNAYNFDGSTEYIHYFTAAPVTAPPWTIMMWARCSTLEARQCGLCLMEQSNASQQGIRHDISQTRPSMSLWDGGVSLRLVRAPTGSMSADTWAQVVSRADASYCSVFVDTVERGPYDTESYGTPDFIAVGVVYWNDSVQDYYEDDQQDIRVYSDDLSDDDIATMYSNENAPGTFYSCGSETST